MKGLRVNVITIKKAVPAASRHYKKRITNGITDLSSKWMFVEKFIQINKPIQLYLKVHPHLIRHEGGDARTCSHKQWH
jgi:hypothetical protein